MRLSVKERQEKFILLLLMTVTMGALFCWALFGGYGMDGRGLKARLVNQINDERAFREAVEEAQPIIDSAYRKIMTYDPSVQAVFLENDIHNQVGAINAVYQRKASDVKYKCFNQQAQFLDMLFNDRKELKGNYGDMDELSKSLDDCKLARRGLQEALMNRAGNK